MPLGTWTRANLIADMFLTYQEESGGLEFTGTGMVTFANDAVREFVMRSGCIKGSARKARVDTSNVEALVVIPTGIQGITRVEHYRQIGASVKRNVMRETSPERLAVAEGADWVTHSEATFGTSPKYHAWYRKGMRHIGLYPPNVTSTAGTVIMYGVSVPTAMANGTSAVPIHSEYHKGVVYLGCRMMAERDADADSERARAKSFDERAQGYIQLAAGG